MITLKGGDIRLPEPCVLAVGKFESIHKGHRALIGEMLRLAQGAGTLWGGELADNRLATALVVFEPHPYRVLFDPAYKPLLTGPERAHVLEGLGLDYLLEYPFDGDFSAMSPDDFCRKLYVELQAQVVVVGQGYRFGRKRAGTVDTLRQYATEYDRLVHEVTPQLAAEGGKTSTSAIRALLLENKLSEAESLLGYPFFVMGTVTPGRQLGRTIGFPTINLYPPEDKFLPTDGVYATRNFLDDRAYNGITNVGVRPTVEGAGAPRSVETYLLGFEGGDLYGKPIRTEFLRFIRPEKKFDSLEALKAQILEDLGTHLPS